MSLEAWENARDGRKAFAAKHGTSDIFEAARIVEEFIGTGKGSADEKARDAFKFILSAWNVEPPEHLKRCESCAEPLDDGDEGPLCEECLEDRAEEIDAERKPEIP